jgi:hypothetical protein
MNNDNLEVRSSETLNDDLPAEYDEALLRDLLKTGVRGKYAARYQQGTNLIKLDLDLAEAFPTEQAVNDALRQFLKNNPLSV